MRGHGVELQYHARETLFDSIVKFPRDSVPFGQYCRESIVQTSNPAPIRLPPSAAERARK